MMNPASSFELGAPVITPGMAAWIAYRNTSDGVDQAGARLPLWANLSARQRQAWDAAANEVLVIFGRKK